MSAGVATAEGSVFPGAECRLEEIGSYTVFHVSFVEARSGAVLRYGIVLDEAGFRAGLYRISAERPLDEAIAQILGHTDDGRDVNALSAFGLLPIDGRRGADGTCVEDVAIYLAEAWERASVDPLPGTRRDRAEAMQARMLDNGLRDVVERIGHDRLRLYDRIHGNALRIIHAHAGCLRIDREAATLLREAGRAYPALDQAIAVGWRYLTPGDSPHATALALMRLFKLDETQGRVVLRRLAGLALPGGLASGHLFVLKDLPPDWIPSDPGEWIALRKLATVLGKASESTTLPIPGLVAHCGGRWEIFAERLAKAARVRLAAPPRLGDDGGSYGELYDAAQDVRDVSLDLRTTLIQPLLAWRDGNETAAHAGEAVEIAARLIFQGRGLARILEHSRAWHRDGGVRIGGRETGTVSWPAVLPPFFRHGLTIVPLASKAALAAEGAAGMDEDGIEGLHHCVETRWSLCVEGQSRIMGVRRASDGTRLSTVEIAFDKDLRPSVREHRGRRNAVTCAAADVALGAYMQALSTGELTFDPAPLAEARLRGRAGNLRQRCGYDWRDEASLAAAIAAWSPHLARSYRGLAPVAFLEAVRGKSIARSGPARADEGSRDRSP